MERAGHAPQAVLDAERRHLKGVAASGRCPRPTAAMSAPAQPAEPEATFARLPERLPGALD
ncbi:hypothetical protein GCM10023205_37000 [Yinghuangia aomiensis]|uniref:Uncharacterized protein n=1 Tax=Yinghuangia aomiensis TaxID=676205 RepID=A0ABP9HDU4_9ACTN